jgi:predicted  nucleic acid-binding Zn-ribbon protein
MADHLAPNPALAALYARADELAIRRREAWEAVDAIEAEFNALEKQIEQEEKGHDGL